VYGQGVTTDAGFTFTFEDWNLYDDAEAWCEATTGSHDERRRKLADPARRQALKDDLPTIATGPLETVTVLTPKSPATERYRQMSVGQAAELMDVHPVDAMLDIAVADDLGTVFFAASPAGASNLIDEILADPYVLLGVSDGGAHTKFFTAGRYPTETLAHHVRERELLSLEDAHWRLSALPASLAGFRDRGTVRVGGPADVVVYDYERLEAKPSEVAHDLPGGEWRRVQRASGYRWIVVNGEITIEDDKETATHSGRLLRHGVG
jgi:N-acyl-D-aspartate/D-glutamate deacylase